MAGFSADGVWLAAVLGDVGVDEIDDVGTDGGLHDVRYMDGLCGVNGHVALQGLNRNERASSCGGH